MITQVITFWLKDEATELAIEMTDRL